MVKYFCKLFLVAIAISLTGTAIKTFRFFYNETATVKEVVCWYVVTLVVTVATIVFCNQF